MRVYMAIAVKDKWACGVAHGIGPHNQVRPEGSFRLFTTYEEADGVARAVARGKYGMDRGQYISNR